MQYVLVLFIPKLPNQEPKDWPDWIINLDILVLLSFISDGTLLAKVFLKLVVCLGFINSSYGNSSSSDFFLFNLDIVPVSFLVTDFTQRTSVLMKTSFGLVFRKRLQDVFKKFRERFQDVLQRCLQHVFKTYYQVRLFMLFCSCIINLSDMYC